MTTAERIDLRVRDVRRRRVEGDEQQVVGGEQHVVTMESKAGDTVPIWVGPSEAIALALRLTGTSTPRPLTYDTMASLVQAADGRITEVRPDPTRGRHLLRGGRCRGGRRHQPCRPAPKRCAEPRAHGRRAHPHHA